MEELRNIMSDDGEQWLKQLFLMCDEPCDELEHNVNEDLDVQIAEAKRSKASINQDTVPSSVTQTHYHRYIHTCTFK